MRIKDIDIYELGDIIRRSYLKHGNNAWVSVASDVIKEINSTSKRDADALLGLPSIKQNLVFPLPQEVVNKLGGMKTDDLLENMGCE